jgi:hypothetical protein
MTRYGTDPLSGGLFTFGQRLRSAEHMNLILPWLRGLDVAAQLMVIKNWPYVHSVGGVECVNGAAWNSTLNGWVLVGEGTGASSVWWMNHPGYTVTAASPTNIGVLSCAACNASGLMIAGSQSTGSTAQKILSGTTGVTWTARNLSGATTEAVTCAFYDSINSQFLVGLTGDKIEYSTDAVTWVAATTGGGGFDMRDFATDGTTLVACCSNSATKFHSSTDGHTWTARTVPSGEYYSIEYQTNWGKFYAATDAVIIESDDGITWSSGTATIPRTACYTYLKQFGDYMVAVALEVGGEVYIYASDDECATWTVLADYFSSASAEPFIESSGSQLCFGQDETFILSLASPTAL